ncbi:MAG: deoxyribonuclease V [bacterium]|nr:deoxyribonuclease V [bacterium]
MKLPRCPHPWNVTPGRARMIQERLAPRVSANGSLGGVRRVAGADLAFTPDGSRCVAGVVVWDLDTQSILEQTTAVRPVRFPYVPGLLTFREGPAVLAALRKLKHVPDAFMFDGQGLAHPRRFGLACHIGVLIDRPSIGCAKSRLIGRHAEPGQSRGSDAALTHEGERIGTVLRTRAGVKSVYVSVGHRVALPSAVELVLRCCTRYRLPEPTRLADQLVGQAKHRL